MRVVAAGLVLALIASSSAVTRTEAPRAATYITDEDIKVVNRQPGIDRTVRVVDIGSENFAIGVIHRVSGGGRAFTPGPDACGEQMSAAPSDATPGGITHDEQTEGYYIISGDGTLVTGGRIANGRRHTADNDVTRILNGPSCSGLIVGLDVVKKVVQTGDIIIIPAGVPHAWIGVTDHVDYLSFRPSGKALEAGYVHPSIRK